MKKLMLIAAIATTICGCSYNLDDSDYRIMNGVRDKEFVEWCKKNNIHFDSVSVENYIGADKRVFFNVRLYIHLENNKNKDL